ncbi:MAG: CGNR zinc finger domain-containing protein [Gaiellaceae bacterium]
MILPREKDDIALAVALVNTWDELEENPELLRSSDFLARLLAAFDLDLVPRDADLVAVRRVRDRLRRAFESETEAEAVEALNGLLRSSGAVPQLERAEGGWSFSYLPRRPSLPALLAGRTAVALLEVVREGGWDRFGRCAASPCCCVYVDRSRNRTRRYCCDLCADRATQAAARRRRRERAASR